MVQKPALLHASHSVAVGGRLHLSSTISALIQPPSRYSRPSNVPVFCWCVIRSRDDTMHHRGKISHSSQKPQLLAISLFNQHWSFWKVRFIYFSSLAQHSSRCHSQSNCNSFKSDGNNTIVNASGRKVASSSGVGQNLILKALKENPGAFRDIYWFFIIIINIFSLVMNWLHGY